MTKPDLEERPLTYEELVARKGDLSVADLLLGLRDGRALVRANAALGLAAIGHTGPDLIPFLRDSDADAARAAAQALAHLGPAQKSHLKLIAVTLATARPAVVDSVVTMMSTLVGKADAELVELLDSTDDATAEAVIEACARVGLRGLQLLQSATADDRALVRFNAIRGVGRLADLEPPSSIQLMRQLADSDSVSDVRAGARGAIASYLARARDAAAAARRGGKTIEPAVPALFERALTPEELRAAAAVAPADELLGALLDPRPEIRLNGARVLALQGAAAAACAPALAVATRDPDAMVRIESVRALAALGAAGGAVVAPALVRALGDADATVVGAAEAGLGGFGADAAAALVDGLDVPDEAHGARVAALIGKLADGAELLRDALTSTSVDVRANAAAGLGVLGKARAGHALLALSATAADKNARVRAAALRAIAQLDPRPVPTLPPIAIDGFDTRVLTEAELGKGKAAITAAGVDGLAPRLSDGRVAVRANAALALGMLGDAPGVVDALALCLRDDAVEVRAAAARAIEQLGAAAIGAAAPDLIGALRTADATLATQLAALLRTTVHAGVADALVRGLETPTWRDARQLCELVCSRPDAVEILAGAFARPGAREIAARGFVMLGKDRLGAGRAALESARSASGPRTRELARVTLAAIDGLPAAPPLPAIADFDARVLGDAELTKGKSALTAAGIAGLRALSSDARPAVRANVALALSIIGDALTAVEPIAVALRDDEPTVRAAAVRALERLGPAALATCAPALVRAFTGPDAALTEQLGAILRTATQPEVVAALVRGLETSDERQARALAALIASRGDAADVFAEAFARPASREHAAAGFVLLGKSRLGTGRAVLDHARTDGPVRARELARATLLAIDGVPPGPQVPAVAGFESDVLERTALAKTGVLDAPSLIALLTDGRAVVRANAATAVGVLGTSAASSAPTVAALLRDDDARVRTAAARALDHLGDDAVLSVAPFLVAALGSDATTAEAARTTLASRGAKVRTALVAGLDTPDETHGLRVADLVVALPDARDLLFAAFDSEAANAQINAAFGIAKLGLKKAGPEGRARLLSGLPGPPTRRRSAILKALDMLGIKPGY